MPDLPERVSAEMCIRDRIYRQVKGLPQEEPEQTAGAQMKAAEQTADTANPSQSDAGNSYGTAPASGTDTEAQPQSSTPKPWEEFARQQQEREDSFFSGDTQQPGDAPVSYTHLDVYKRQVCTKRNYGGKAFYTSGFFIEGADIIRAFQLGHACFDVGGSFFDAGVV